MHRLWTLPASALCTCTDLTSQTKRALSLQSSSFHVVRLVSIQLHAVFVGLPSRMVGFPGAPVGEALTDRYLGSLTTRSSPPRTRRSCAAERCLAVEVPWSAMSLPGVWKRSQRESGQQPPDGVLAFFLSLFFFFFFLGGGGGIASS